MRKEHKPLLIKRLSQTLDRWYVERKLRPQFDSLGDHIGVLQPRSIQLFGRNLRAGNYLHLISDKLKPINLNTWQSKQNQGHLTIGDYCLISPGVTISSAVDITIKNSCMIAAEVYISDSDWHGVYNRTRPFRCDAPIIIEDNVWIGYRTIIGKGVSIGENSIIGAGAVVTSPIPKNAIAAGNPARVVKTIDSKKRMLTREFLFNGGLDYWNNQKLLDEYLMHDNSLIDWLRASFFPNRFD